MRAHVPFPSRNIRARLVIRTTSSASLDALLSPRGPAWHYNAALWAVLPAVSRSPALRELLVRVEASPARAHQLMASVGLLAADTRDVARKRRVVNGLALAKGVELDNALSALAHFPSVAALCEG